MTWIARLAFAAALTAVTWQSLTPTVEDTPLIPWDKARHFLAFYLLTGLAVIAGPRVRLAWVALGLIVYGGAIEIVQGVVGRDRDFFDLLADGAGVFACYAAMAAQWMRAATKS